VVSRCKFFAQPLSMLQSVASMTTSAVLAAEHAPDAGVVSLGPTQYLAPSRTRRQPGLPSIQPRTPDPAFGVEADPVAEYLGHTRGWTACRP
jgi:hypothetical protein